VKPTSTSIPSGLITNRAGSIGASSQLPSSTSDLGDRRVEGQAGLPVDINPSVSSPPDQRGHPLAMSWVVEHLQLQPRVVGVVLDLEVQHPVDGP
jgi:hypothetical protein